MVGAIDRQTLSFRKTYKKSRNHSYNRELGETRLTLSVDVEGFGAAGAFGLTSRITNVLSYSNGSAFEGRSRVRG